MLVIVPVELVDIAAARLVLLVCIDTCKVCLLFPPTGHLCLFLQMKKKYELGADPFCGVVEI